MIILIHKDKSLSIIDQPVSGARLCVPYGWTHAKVYEYIGMKKDLSLAVAKYKKTIKIK